MKALLWWHHSEQCNCYCVFHVLTLWRYMIACKNIFKISNTTMSLVIWVCFSWTISTWTILDLDGTLQGHNAWDMGGKSRLIRRGFCSHDDVWLTSKGVFRKQIALRWTMHSFEGTFLGWMKSSLSRTAATVRIVNVMQLQRTQTIRNTAVPNYLGWKVMWLLMVP